MLKTNEGGIHYEHSLSHALEFFSKAGSLFVKAGQFYEGSESALSLFQKSWIVDKELTFKLLLWLRDCRGGAGNRSGAREIYQWLGENDPEWVTRNISWLPMVGRWDDLRSLFGTQAQDIAVSFWVSAIRSGEVLAAKWADRKDIPLRSCLNLKPSAFRKLLAKTRSPHIVESKMCAKEWEEIEYEKVPSVAMARYTKAFGRHDEERFNAYKESLKKGEGKIHAGTLFPHDCVRTAIYGDYQIADAQFDELPNYMEGTDEKIVVISDTSGSMGITISGSIRAVDISQGLALYCSSRFPEESPFYKRFIGFCSEGSFKSWRGKTFSQAISDRRVFDGAVGSTRIDKALLLLLNTAIENSISQEQMPSTLLIVSDMQFHSGGVEGKSTEVEKVMKQWEEKGYKRPKVVYWNTVGYPGAPTTTNHKDVGMISGFSAGVLKAVLSGDEFTPAAIMMRALEKYEIENPDISGQSGFDF